MASSRLDAALFSASTVMPVCFRAPDAAACTMATESWPDTAPVTRSCSSWASSTTTTSYSGSTARPSKALTASMAWLVTTTSASAAFCRASSLKHSAAMRAFLRAQALHRGDGDLPPGTVRDAGQQFVPVPRGGLLGPLAQPDHFLAELGGRAAHGGGEVRHGGVLAEGEQLALRRLFGGEPAFELVPAHVVGAALDQGHLDGPAPAPG